MAICIIVGACAGPILAADGGKAGALIRGPKTVAYLCCGLAAVLLVAAIAGFIHARKRSAEREVLPRVDADAADE